MNPEGTTGKCIAKTGAWAAEKLDYLARYMDVFETSMRQKWHVCTGDRNDLVGESGGDDRG